MKRYAWLLCLLALVLALLCGCGGGSSPLQDDAGNPAGEDKPETASESDAADESSQQEFRPGEVVQLEPEEVFDFEGYDWEGHLREDAFESGTAIGDAALEVLELRVDAVNDASLSVTVTAPDLSQALWDWYAQTEEPTGTGLEAQILALLSGEKESSSFTLSYALSHDGEPVIDYTEDYAAAVSCGLLQFHTALQESFLEELGGAVYE